jgi:hypothetical protein
LLARLTSAFFGFRRLSSAFFRSLRHGTVETRFLHGVTRHNILKLVPSFLSLAATAEGELWPPEQSASILLYSSFIHPRLIVWLLNNSVFMV